MKKHLTEGFHQTNKQVFFQSIALINSAFALVAALAWNEAIKAFIERFFPSGSGLYSRFAYALIITAFVVIVTSRLSRVMARFAPPEDEN